MHTDDLSDWMHDHAFHQGSAAAERGTRIVLWITAVTMVIEIAAGWWFNSMALTADGWHMSSHAVAIGLSVLAYATARRYATDPRFAFGTWKVEVLGGFASAIFLLGVAGMMAFGSVERLMAPQVVQFREALVVAVAGLLVNLVCALILGQAHHHDHDHGHGHAHGHGAHHDLNLKSAYVHVITDAATSVLAIAALAGGWLYGWSWLDPLMGIVGAAVVAVWAKGLIVDTAKVLLDREMDHPVVDEIRDAIEAGSDDRVADLHVWRVGKQVYSCAVTVVTRDCARTPDDVRRRLAVHEEIVHSTIEVQVCPRTPVQAGPDPA
ncbi:CDF family Co(II)/Ni(II) efflux transporter DmeF [Ramlibacter sp.]|uniref:CDF family Co(II)/Ni(II) efflux transporter DmeF n=1 Tax=Ramlibacter sp. TaxID=1917967 RepID=UPI002B5D607C|nr:CDF family Co(II)/Ni(II) efflux transporter DmeF [Ramlibacter sp.]HWI83947.1 CDF family Co(II)/Ni(II) efflux transporter DmeF [Ramlibacter sp.]